MRLELRGLTVPGRLASLSLRVDAGSIHALVGPNGSGKSTALRCVLGLEPFLGDVHRAPGRLAFVAQQVRRDDVLPMTVLEFLALGRTRWPVALGVRASLRRHLEHALQATEAAPLLHRPLHTLSAGERQRVVLANAFDPRPELLVLDEPETGLDPDGCGLLEANLRRLRAEGAAVLLVSHDAGLVERLADGVTRCAGVAHG